MTGMKNIIIMTEVVMVTVGTITAMMMVVVVMTMLNMKRTF